MTGLEEGPEPVDVAPGVPLDQSTPPIDQIQRDLTGDVPLEQTRAETREVLSSEGIPEHQTRQRD